MPDNNSKFQCQACQRWYPWKAELAGKRMRCKCGQPVTVPAAVAEPADDEGPPDFGSEDFAEAVALTASMPAKPVTSTTPRSASAKGPTAGAGPAAKPGKEKLSDRWWFTSGMGLFVLVSGFYEFSRFSELETHGGIVYLGRVEYLMYTVAGKWGVLIGLVLLGAFCIAVGVHKAWSSRRS